MLLPDDIGIYIHWPFCESKCAYCDFNSHVREAVDHLRWRDALLRELRHEAALTPGRRVASIFFGGGTPSLMQAATVAALIDAVKALWPTTTDLEITLEANPSSVEADKFAAFAQAGVNRLSLGIQSLDDDVLRFLTRRHDAAQARTAIDVAQKHFPRLSFDLIYARPDQSVSAWQKELTEALAFGTRHMSLYQLTIEPNTGFAGSYKRGAFLLPDEDASVALFEATQALMDAAGLPLYEISNHAAPTHACRHNLIYWTYCDYIGIGPGAHGRRNAAATTRLKRPEAWLQAVEQLDHGIVEAIPLDAVTRGEEALLMGLRLADGIDAAWFVQRSGLTLGHVIDPDAAVMLQEQGLITYTPSNLRTTARGALLLNAVIAKLCTTKMLRHAPPAGSA
jgi:putative oxygen-independent coproporphyrinogen III oxidase